MKLTLNELQRGFVSLGKLANQDLPLKTGYWLGRIAKAAEAEMKTLEDSRIKLVKRLGVEDEAGNYTIPADAMDAFSAEMGDLLEVSIELPGERIKLESLGDSVKLSAIDLINLDWLFEAKADAEKSATAGA
jgi:hypothetical protein